MSDGKGRRPLTSKERKSLEKQRKNAAKQAEKYHKEKAKQDKRAKKSPNPKKEQQKKAPKSKIEEAFLKQKEEQESQRQAENMSREELITIILSMQGQLAALNENIEKLIEQVRLATVSYTHLRAHET